MKEGTQVKCIFSHQNLLKCFGLCFHSKYSWSKHSEYLQDFNIHKLSENMHSKIMRIFQRL